MSTHNYKAASQGTTHKTLYSEPIKIPGFIWFYGLWFCLALFSTLLEHSIISTRAVLFLLGGIVTTNFFFLSAAYTEKENNGPSRLLMNYQIFMGAVWTSAYLYFSSGAGDLVLGMYMTVLMFAHLIPLIVDRVISVFSNLIIRC